jgi:hypothetical protein
MELEVWICGYELMEAQVDGLVRASFGRAPEMPSRAYCVLSEGSIVAYVGLIVAREFAAGIFPHDRFEWLCIVEDLCTSNSFDTVTRGRALALLMKQVKEFARREGRQLSAHTQNPRLVKMLERAGFVSAPMTALAWAPK